MGGSCVNFHNFSMDPVRVKIGECYYYARHFSIGFPNYAKNRHATCYFEYNKLCLPNGFEIFMVVYVKHGIATVIFVDFSEQFYYILL
jgi:hypothetical protein